MKALSPVSGTSTDTVSFLGLTLQPKSLHEMNLLVEEGVRDHRNWIIANHNLHSLYLLHRHPELREFYSGVQWTHIDGMPLVALGRLYGYPLERRHRVTLVDWTYPLMELAASKGWRVFHLGSSNGSAEKGAARLRTLYPGLQLEVSSGYFDARYGSSENEAMIERINAYRPDLLMVGMGMPRQEIWTQENYARLKANVILSSVGAAFDYVAGAVPTPPRWSGRMGLEWAFRLAHDPVRLFGRYFIEPWYILLLLLFDYPRHRTALKFRTGTQEVSWRGVSAPPGD
ncbi:MAG: WecB/TagA/CpsF family glycosyltransferase [Acidobacteriaceae bacterium]|jgi:N-acetylglucosaminyldiphosphoundecaprenol N-acetyl-beta-D-mannosaminyltransferase